MRLLGSSAHPMRNEVSVMAAVNDVRGQKVARAEFARRQVDISRANLFMNHGVLYVRGEVLPSPDASYGDLQNEMYLIARILRQRPEIREVILETTYGIAPVLQQRRAA